MVRRTGVAVAALLLAGEARGAPPPLVPGDDDAETRSILRDVDRTRTNVAGEADAAAVVANPASMGFMRAVGGVIEGSWTRPEARRRGSGVGAFVALPLSLKLFGQTLAQNFLALGVGYQHLRPARYWPANVGLLAAPAPSSVAVGASGDLPYHKLTFALAVPLMRWVPGLSVGLSYSRLWSRLNAYADDVNQFDVSAIWRPHRAVAVGVAARGLNTPTTGPDGESLAPLAMVQPFELDPEVAVRPIRGTRALEIAAGVRVTPVTQGSIRFITPPLLPRLRVEAGGRGARVFAEGELFAGRHAAPFLSNMWRVTAGVEVDLAHVGLAAAPVFSGYSGGGAVAAGFAGKLRVSAERWASVADGVGEALRLQLEDFKGDRGMYRLVEELDRLGRRRGALVVLELEGLRYGWAQIEEVREAMLRLRARGGKVVAYLQGGGMKDYFLAAAADRIVAHPNSRLSIVGLRVEVYFFADLLEKLGAKAEFVRIAEYKSRPESFSERTSTPPSAEQRTLLMNDTWNHLVRTIARGRRTTPEAVAGWIDAAPHTPDEALRRGLVDEIGYPDELEARLGDWQAREVVLKERTRRPAHAQAYGPGPEIAVLHLEGTMSDGDSLEVPIVGAKLLGSRTIVREIRRLRDDRRVKAVVVRIDSPGGSVACADAIARELDLTRAKKPVVISMGNAAASGGYYVATAGQYIFSDALTRTGSIGIFRPKVDLSGTLKLLGVGVDEVSIGAKAGLYSWLKPYTPAEREAAQRGIEASYKIFLDRVARARRMTPDAVDRLARGRVWAGVRAQEIGLVDEYGGLREAILYARKQAQLFPEDGEVRHYPPPANLAQQVEALFGLKLPSPLGGDGQSGPLHGALGSAGLVWVLRRLPASVWLTAGPEPLALSDEVVTVE
jgi:protease-4